MQFLSTLVSPWPRCLQAALAALALGGGSLHAMDGADGNGPIPTPAAPAAAPDPDRTFRKMALVASLLDLDAARRQLVNTSPALGPISSARRAIEDAKRRFRRADLWEVDQTFRPRLAERNQEDIGLEDGQWVPFQACRVIQAAVTFKLNAQPEATPPATGPARPFEAELRFVLAIQARLQGFLDELATASSGSDPDERATAKAAFLDEHAERIALLLEKSETALGMGHGALLG